MPKFPTVHVKLSGEDGNAFAILGRVSKALKKARISEDEQKAFMDEATSGDYNALLQCVIKTVSTS